MTYIPRTTASRRYRGGGFSTAGGIRGGVKGGSSLGGLLDILDPWGLVHEGGVYRNAIVGPASEECAAVGAAKTKDMEAKRLDLAATWHPTGYYTLDDAASLINGALHSLEAALGAVQESLGDRQLEGHKDALTQVKGTILSKMDKAQPFLQALAEARSKGIEVLDAPGLQRYIMNTMRDVEWATESIAFIACMRPFWVSVLGAIETALDVLWSIAKAVGGVVKKAGQIVMKVPDVFGTVMTIAKYGALAFGVYWVATGGPKKLLAKAKTRST